jgi:hypothetical protein
MKTTCLLGFFSLLFFLSCGISSRHSGNSPQQPNSKYCVSYYRKNNEFLYFVKPITFESQNSSIIADFTFRKINDSILDTVTVNYSVISKNKLETDFGKNCSLDSFPIKNNTLVFQEFNNKKYIQRYSGFITSQQFRKISNTSKIFLYFSRDTIVCSPSNYAKKALNHVKKLY